jgi:NAD(P)-dependent dehydrogenase (short-subunit alcohol dehydrogenase family)
MVRSEVILKDKVALITGGTRGIGAAIAKELYDLGATIIITGTQPDFKYTHNYQYICANFLKKKSLNELVNKIRKQKIDILVNNAGINRIGPISELSVNDFEKVQQVNVTAPFMLCQTVLLGMSERGWGRVVNISSIWGKISKAHRAPYSASKFAIDGLTAAISAEVASDGVLVNSIAPGFIDTELTRNVLGVDGMNELAQQVPAKRVGTVEEIAKFVAWLAGPDNTYISGQNIAIDGGYTRV